MLSSSKIGRLAPVICALVLAACCGGASDDFCPEGLKAGDLVFRCGRSVSSAALKALGESSRSFTHVGIVCPFEGKLVVVHAVPSELDGRNDFDRVRISSLEDFLSRRRASSVSFCHVSVGAADVSPALDYALECARDSVRFDSSYDLYDSSRLYCTELVRNAYLCVGVDISSECIRTLGLVGRDVLLPSDLFSSSYVKPYVSIKRK